MYGFQIERKIEYEVHHGGEVDDDADNDDDAGKLQ